MSIVCTLEPKVNIFKGPATKNVLLLKNSSVAAAKVNDALRQYGGSVSGIYATAAAAAGPAATLVTAAAASPLNKDKTDFIKYAELEQHQQQQHHIIGVSQQQQEAQLQQHLQRHNGFEYNKPRISMNEFVATASTIGGSNTTANINNSNSSNSVNCLSGDFQSHGRLGVAMPADSQSANTKSSQKLLCIKTATTAAATPVPAATSSSAGSSSPPNMSNTRMTSVSPSLSANGSSNEATNVHSLSMYGPMSPQSSDSGHSLSDMPPHISAHAFAHMTKQQQQQHKELFSQRKTREFTPDNKKDDSYWDRRRRNNEAAKRSREKRRYNDMVLEQRVVELTKENHVLKAQLDAIRDKFNISGENLVNIEHIMASLPTTEQVLSITKRVKLNNGSSSNGGTAYTAATGGATNIAGGNASNKLEPANIKTGSNHLYNVAANQLAHGNISHYAHENFAGVSPPPSNGNAAGAAIHHSIPASVIAAASTSSELQNGHLHPNLHVLQALNRNGNVSCDDLDNLRKVVAVVGSVAAAELPGLFSGPGPAAAALYAATPNGTSAAGNFEIRSYGAAAAQMDNSANNVSSSAAEAVSSSSSNSAVAAAAAAATPSVLNLSRHAGSPSYEHLLSSTTSSTSSRNCSSLSSSASSSGAVSGDDEHEGSDDFHHMNTPSDANNCLPLKLRHKSHLGDKDAAATALLALQNIKQEPISHRASPPAWTDGGDNSSDERDSGISIGSAEWTAHFQQRKLSVSPSPNKGLEPNAVVSPVEQEVFKSKLARLESEVDNMKKMMMLTNAAEKV